MSSAVTTAPRVNGDSVVSPEARRIADFYEKLFQLRDEVFAGKHPRIKLPDFVLEQVAPHPVQNGTPSSSRPATNGTPYGTYSSPQVPTRPDSSSFLYQPTAPFVSQLQNAQRPFSAKSTSSGIDPVLLTKSEHLIRAEIQLKRLQIERVLKDQVDKRGQIRDKDLGVDSESRFDVDELLAKAQELVKPMSGLQITANRSSDASDSFDENSYYSSQANSWSSEEADSAKIVNNADAAAAVVSQGKSSVGEARPTTLKSAVSQDPRSRYTENQTFTDLQDEEPYEPADDIELYEPAPVPRREEREESEYSPPPAGDGFTADQHTAGAGHINNHRGQGRDVGTGTSSSINGYGYNRPSSPTSPSVPVIRNHIRSPVAPQPSRVSPLAVAKVSRLDQGRHDGRGDQGRPVASPRLGDIGTSTSHADHASPRTSRRQSPAVHPQSIQNPRKRRREDKRSRAANKRVARSPEPYIKEEPMSPPPFASYSDPQPSKRRALQPLPGDVEIISSRDARAQPVFYREQEPIPRAYRQYEEPPSPTVLREPSRIAHRRIERDDQDLRRVASLQHARRPYSPVGAEPLPYSANETRQIRASSHAFVDRPSQAPIYREASVRPSVAPRYIRERSRSPIHEYLPRAHSPMIMAPPSSHVVVDQYGNKYYAAPVDARESVAPPSRRVEVEPYFERAVTREPALRARAAEPYEEEDDIQRMPPPPLRRYAEPSDVEIIEPRSRRQREYSVRPVDAEYPPVREVMERRPVVYHEEMAPPREYVSRSFSVRPEVVRREAPGEYTTIRHESAQPGYIRRSELPSQRYREVSVQRDPYDDRRYAYTTPSQSRRYVDEHGVVERPVEVAQEPYAGETRRVSYRY